MRIIAGFTEDEIQIIKTNYPTFVHDIKEYIMGGRKGDLDKLMETAPQNVKEGIDTMADMMLAACFRDLYDFFDTNEVYVCSYPDVSASDGEANPPYFSAYYVKDTEMSPPVTGADRVLAERAVFLQIIEIYERENGMINV